MRPQLFSALVTQSIAVRFEDLDKDESGFVDFEEFAVLSTVMGKHTHPIFEKGQRAMQETMKSGPPTAIETVDSEAIRRRAAKAWRKFVSLRAFDELSISQAFRRVDAKSVLRRSSSPSSPRPDAWTLPCRCFSLASHLPPLA